MRKALLAGILLAALAWPAGAYAAVSLQPVGSFAEPIYVTAPNGDPRLFVVERSGTIRVVKGGATLATPFLDISTLVDTTGERGLLSMAFDPNYASTGVFYVFFNDNGTAGATQGDIHVDEFQVTSNPDVASAASRRPVLTIPHSGASNHNGGQLQFGPDGALYISVGDAAISANAQTLSNMLGKLLRIDPHGSGPGAYSVPASNPFVGVGGARAEIWSLGLRNPWRFSFDHLTGDIAIADVGGGLAEEVDYATQGGGLGRGANYGWPSCEGFSGSCGGFTAPVFAYPHGGGPCYAITGGYVYRGSQVPELSGRYLYADYCGTELRSLQLGLPLASGDRSDAVPLASPISFGEDANCDLYVAQQGGVVAKIVSTAPPAGTAASCTPGPAKKKCKKRKHRKRKHHSAAAAKKKKHKKRKKRKCKRKRKHKKKRKH